jgi:HNH endonuclease/AP2 domain
MAERELTKERLQELLEYDPLTGVFTWRVDRFCGGDHKATRVRAGDVAGCKNQNGPHRKRDGERRTYIRITIDGCGYSAHRLAHLYVTGQWPPEDIDHEDLDGLNNRWTNLRPCTQTLNNANTIAPGNNTSSHKGVSWDRLHKKWCALIQQQGVRYRLGYFDDPEDAAAAYAAKAKELFGEFARVA